MQLTEQETTLLDAFRRLPKNAAEQVEGLVRRMAAIPANANIDWSDEWSDIDLREFTAHSANRLGGED